MPVIIVNSASFCGAEEILDQMTAQTGYVLLNDEDLVAETAIENNEDITEIKKFFVITKNFSGRMKMQRSHALAKVKTTLAKYMLAQETIIHGICSMMAPRDICHVLNVGIMADLEYRTKLIIDKMNVFEPDAQEILRQDDLSMSAWSEALGFGDPWDPSKYDLFIPMHRKTVQDAVKSIIKYSGRRYVNKTDRSMEKAGNFLLASKVETALAREGHEVRARAYGSEVVLTIPKNIILLHKLQGELLEIASKVPGVGKVNTELSKEFYKKQPTGSDRQKAGAKLLLVDDEREFVHTLSERLLMREIGSAVVYDGEQALAYIEEENPPVIILDLKMPGIDGIEVLRRVRATHPDIDVIILSGHGSREDEKRCLELGAVAYLQKPVDIDNLTSLLKKIHDERHDLNRTESGEN